MKHLEHSGIATSKVSWFKTKAERTLSELHFKKEVTELQNTSHPVSLDFTHTADKYDKCNYIRHL